MDVAVNIADNGLNRIPEPGQPNSSESMSFANPVNDGGVLINGNGAIMSSTSIPPMPTCSSNTLTSSTTGFHENGINHGTQQQNQPHQFIHGRSMNFSFILIDSLLHSSMYDLLLYTLYIYIYIYICCIQKLF